MYKINEQRARSLRCIEINNMWRLMIKEEVKGCYDKEDRPIQDRREGSVEKLS